MRRAARVDRNHGEIVEALRRIGAEVTNLAAIGHGCPDLLVSHRGRWYVVEVKDGELPPSARMLTDDQVAWHRRQRAPVHVVDSVEGAIGCLIP